MRNTHGPGFNINTVKALLALWNGLSKSEKESILKDCKSVLDTFKNEVYKGNVDGVFNGIDT